jgi:hypothetical protein
MKNILLTTLLSISLAGCNMFDKHVKCDDPKGLELVKESVKNSITTLLDKDLKLLISSKTVNDLDPSKLKLSLNNVKFDYQDSRTDNIDPDSTKTVCSIDLTITIPQEIIKKSDISREYYNKNNFEKQATDLNIIYNQGKIEIPLTYILQPTDKGDKIIAYIQNDTDIKSLIKDTLIYAFLKNQIDKDEINSQNNLNTSNSISYEEVVVASEASTYSDY